MKKLLLLCAIALCAVCSNAETHYKPHISIGARAGVSLSNVSFSPSIKQGLAMGTAGTVCFRYSEEKLFGVIAEFGWADRGWKENYELLPLEYRRRITYVTLPILTHIYFGPRRVKFFVNLGPSFSLMLGSGTTSNFNYNNISEVPDFPRNRRTEQLTAKITNSFDYGINGGLGMEVFITRGHSVLLEARYYFGLGNIFPSSKADTFSASRNNSIEVSLGYYFRLK